MKLYSRILYGSLQAVAEPRPFGRQPCPHLRHPVLVAKPAERRPHIGFVVREGLGRDANAGVVQLAHRHTNCVPARRNSTGGALQPFGDLPRRADPMPPGLHRQVSGLFDGRNEGGERRLQEGGVGGVMGTGAQVRVMDGDAR